MSDGHESPRIGLRIVSQKGRCAFGHEVGQEFDVTGATPEGICPSAFHSAYPAIFALKYGAQLPWEEEPGTAHIACPDAENPLTMKISREG
jgi:uncharacterized repeat protein (TIGR04076 family)